jgi:Conjugative transposon protein TcpC
MTRTPADLVRVVGRGVLWCVLALLLIRGASDVMAAREPAPVVREARATAGAWPDDEARAFAVEFARAYLGWSPRVQELVVPEIAHAIAPEHGARARPPVVEAATVARTARIDARHALVTVDAGDGRFLTVPVARDAANGLVVYDLPSLATPPAQAQLAPLAPEPLPATDRAAIEDVVERFLRAFLAGRSEELEYLVPPGTRIGALAHEHELVGLVSVAQSGQGAGREREVLASVRARDAQSRAVYALRYRLSLVREDRWYVAAVNATPKEG